MKAFLAAVLLVGVLAGCNDKGDQGPAGPAGSQGPAGPQGPQDIQGLTGSAGGGLYTSRSSVKCNTVTMGVDPPAPVGVVAHCDSDLDLPLVGSCAANSAPGGTLTLLFNGPVSWDANSTGQAAWSCAWANSGGGQVNVPDGQATICCIKHP